MIIISEKVKIKGKEEIEGIARNGNPYKNKAIYFEDKDGTTITLPFNNDIVFNKAIKDKEYKLKYYLAPNGRLTLNDIEEIK